MLKLPAQYITRSCNVVGFAFRKKVTLCAVEPGMWTIPQQLRWASWPHEKVPSRASL